MDNLIELQEHLIELQENIQKFVDFVEENEEFNDSEFEFLEDHSNISNTDLDNLLESLYHISETIDRMKQ